jgi:hypothetical protein
MASGRDRIREVNKKVNGEKKERFLTLRMWLSYFVSLTTRDRGTIPENIGNNILITNNMYVTKNFLSSMIQVIELSLDTPITLLGEMIMHEFRKEGCSAIADFTVKNKRKDINLADSGLKSRIKMWENSDKNSFLLQKDKKRAVRLLYTVDQIQEGQEIMESRIFLTIRAKTGTELAKAERLTYRYLAKIGCIFKPINTSLNDCLQYVSLLSDHKGKNVKSMHAVINSNKTLSQLLPNTHSPGSSEGVFLGTNIINNMPFRVNLKKIEMGRNIYVLNNTGGGKTALILNMCSSALEENFNVCMMDIKGNEYGGLVDSVGGATISLRESSEEYINSFVMLKEEATNDTAERYFKSRLNFSKLQMVILSGVKDEDKTMQLEGFIDEFLNYLYTAIGVRADNRNTWHLTLNLTPYTVYDRIDKFLNQEIKNKYRDVINYIITNLRMFFSRTGSKSYIFTKELQYNDLLDRRAIRFDFGILAGSSYDATIFRLKFEYMSRINGEYITRNYDSGIDTLKVLEESQAVSEDVIESYAREYTLRRAQRQTTVLIGNSVDALVSNPKAMPLIETTTALLLGKLSKSTADLVIKHFDIGNKEGMIRHMSKNNQYMRHYLFINNMEPKALSPIIKVQYDPEVKYKLLTPSKSGNVQRG